MARGPLILAVLLVLAGLTAGCGGSSEPATDESEATSVADIAKSHKEATDEAISAADGCEETTGDDGSLGIPPKYTACFKRNAEPLFKARDQATVRAAREIAPDVGPACRRSLRATAVGIESEQAVPEVDIGEAAKTCKREVAK